MSYRGLVGWSDINPEAERALLDRLVESGTFIVGIGPMPTTKATEERVATLDGCLESAPPLPADLLRAFGNTHTKESHLEAETRP